MNFLRFRIRRVALAVIGATSIVAFAADESHGHVVAPGAMPSEPEAQLFVEAPLPDALANGALVLPFHTEHLQIASLAAAPLPAGSPRTGHLHLALDGAAWHWVQADAGPIVMFGLSAGSHTLLVELADVNHRVLDKRSVAFTIPKA